MSTTTIFQNIHHHDKYSLRAGLGDVDDLIKKTKEFGQKYLGITNYNELSGWVKQYFSCLKNDIVPIFGVQMLVSNYRVVYNENNRKEIEKILFCGVNKQIELKVEEMTVDEKVAVGVNWHLLLYAKNLTGFYNIIKIHNDAQLYGVYEYPRTTNQELAKYSEGISCIIPSVNGEIINDIDNNREKFAIAKYNAYKKMFGDVYLELVIAEDDDYIEINNKVVSFCKKHNIPMVIGINSHYINKEDESSFDALLTVYKNGDKRPEINKCTNMSYKSTEQVYELFCRKFKNEIFTEEVFSECIDNLHVFCESIESFQLDTSIKMPTYNNADKILEEKSWEGLRHRGFNENPIYVQRLKYELDNVIRAGFADYFLFLEDICAFCRKNKIALGTGRGCFTPNMRVKLGNKLYKYIEDCKAGDIVISGLGNKKEIEKVFEYDIEEDLVELVLEDNRVIKLTKEHEVKVKRQNEIKWIKAIDLNIDVDEIVEIKDL